jgi:hypothetical protein
MMLGVSKKGVLLTQSQTAHKTHTERTKRTPATCRILAPELVKVVAVKHLVNTCGAYK